MLIATRCNRGERKWISVLKIITIENAIIFHSIPVLPLPVSIFRFETNNWARVHIGHSDKVVGNIWQIAFQSNDENAMANNFRLSFANDQKPTWDPITWGWYHLWMCIVHCSQFAMTTSNPIKLYLFHLFLVGNRIDSKISNDHNGPGRMAALDRCNAKRYWKSNKKREPKTIPRRETTMIEKRIVDDISRRQAKRESNMHMQPIARNK